MNQTLILILLAVLPTALCTSQSLSTDICSAYGEEKFSVHRIDEKLPIGSTQTNLRPEGLRTQESEGGTSGSFQLLKYREMDREFAGLDSSRLFQSQGLSQHTETVKVAQISKSNSRVIKTKANAQGFNRPGKVQRIVRTIHSKRRRYEDMSTATAITHAVGTVLIELFAPPVSIGRAERDGYHAYYR
jgi:hypothetical protein